MLPPFNQQPSLHPNAIVKLSPLRIPVFGLSPLLTPDMKISTEPFFKVLVVQCINMAAWQLMSAAGSPVSIRVSEVQVLPVSLVKNTPPVPLLGIGKLKFRPVIAVHFGQPSGASPPPVLTA